MTNQYQLNNPNITITEATLRLAISNARIAIRWNNEPESEGYWRGQIDAYQSLLNGML